MDGVQKNFRLISTSCLDLVKRFRGKQIDDKTKCKLIQSHLSKELILLLTLDKHYQALFRTKQKLLRARFLKEVEDSDWFCYAQGWGFTVKDAKNAFMQQRKPKMSISNNNHHPISNNKAPQSSARKVKKKSSFVKRKAEEPGQTTDTDDPSLSSKRATNRRNAGLIAKHWKKFMLSVLELCPEKERWVDSALDLSKAPNRGSHWLFKVFQAFQQVMESFQDGKMVNEVNKLHSSSSYQDTPGQWEYLNGAFDVPQQRLKNTFQKESTSKSYEEYNRLPSSFVKWNKLVLEFFSQPSSAIKKEMPMVIQKLKQSVFVSSIQRVTAASTKQKEDDLRECVAEFLKTSSWPPLWLTCWVGHLILLSEDTQWNREPKRLVVELNEKDTYFFYDRGGWQNHWTEERDGLAAAGKGILCCAWDSKTSFLSIFAPSPAQWSCRLAMVYLLKKGRTLLSDQPRYGDLYLASKSAPLERGSLGTYGHVSAFMPRLSITSKQAGGRMGLLHDMHTALFWKQALTLLFLYCLERHSVREARSPGSKAASLILPSWFADLTSTFLVYFNEILSSDTRPTEFSSLSASVIMSTKILPILLLSLSLPMLTIKSLPTAVKWEQVKRATHLEELSTESTPPQKMHASAHAAPEERIFFLGQQRTVKWFPQSQTLLIKFPPAILALRLDVHLAKPVFVIAHCTEHAKFLEKFLSKHLAFLVGNRVQTVGVDPQMRSAEPNLLCRLNMAEELEVGRNIFPEENRFDEIDLFTYKSSNLQSNCWIYTMPLESLSHALDPTQVTPCIEPSMLLFWGVNSLVNIELNSPDIWKQKRMAYHEFEKLGRDDIPRVMILEPYYIDQSKELKQQTYRKIIRSCCVSRSLLHFVVHAEPLKCQKIRGTAAGKGSTCFSKSFLDCKLTKKEKEDVWKRTQDKVVAKTFSRPLRLRDVVRSPGNDLGNVCFIVYEELSPLCHDNMQPLWNKLNSDRDKKVFLTLCFGEPLSVVWSSRYKAHQVYKLCSVGMGEEDKETHIKTFKPNEAEVTRLLDNSGWIINSGMRIALSCVIHQALLKGVCIMNVEQRHSCQTIPPLLTHCLKRLKQHLDQQRMVTLVDLPTLWSQIYEQNSLWTPMSNSNVHNFQGYIESIDKYRKALESPCIDPRNLHFRPNSSVDHKQKTNFVVNLTCELHFSSSSAKKTIFLSGKSSLAVKDALEKAGCLKIKAPEYWSCVVNFRHLFPGKGAMNEQDFLAPAFENVCTCLSRWEPGQEELSHLFKSFCEADPCRLLPETFRLCRLLFEKTNLQQLCGLLNWCWLFDFGELFQLLCVALSVGQLSPLYSNLNSYQETMCRDSFLDSVQAPNPRASPSTSPINTNSSSTPSHVSRSKNTHPNGKTSTPLIQAEDNIRTTIDDSSMFFAQKKAQYQLLGKRLWEHGLLSSDLYTHKGTPEFWNDSDLAFCSCDSKVHVTVQSASEGQGKKGHTDIKFSYVKRGCLNLIDTVLTTQGHRKPLTLKNNTFIWVVESNLLPNGTRLSTTAVSVPLPLSAVIHNKIPLDRFTGPVFMPLPSRFSKKVNIHKKLYWDIDEALKDRLDLETHSKLLASDLSLKLEPRHLQNVPSSVKKSVAFYPPLLFRPFPQVSARKKFSENSKRKELKRIKKEQNNSGSKRGRKRKQMPGTSPKPSYSTLQSPVSNVLGKPLKKQKLVGGDDECVPALPQIVHSPLMPLTSLNMYASQGKNESGLDSQTHPMLQRAFHPVDQTEFLGASLSSLNQSSAYFSDNERLSPGDNDFGNNEFYSVDSINSDTSTKLNTLDSHLMPKDELQNHAGSFDAFSNMMKKLNADAV